jgi:hypothetical protein
MTGEPLQTSTLFRADLGLLENDAVTAFTTWADANCKHHYVMRSEQGSTVLYARRENSKTSKQYRNALRALASNRNIKLNLGALTLMLPEEYKAATFSMDTDTTKHCDALPDGGEQTWCGREQTLLSKDFDVRSQEMYRQLLGSPIATAMVR